MKLERILTWIDTLLEPSRFDDVSNNGLQIARRGDDVKKVAFAVDASAKSVRAAAEAGAELLVVHHGISWGGGIRRLTDGAYEVVRAAMDADLALAAYHLPLDANRKVGNNWELARYFNLTKVEPAFSYHGNVIGVVGFNAHGRKIGICSGGAGEFAEEAKRLGCDLYVTGEASWGDVIAAENVGMKMITAGHYQTETFGVKALMKAMAKSLKVATTFVSLALALTVGAAEAESEEECGFDRWYVGAAAELVLPQGGLAKTPRLGGATARVGYYLTDWAAVEGAASALENRAGLAARALVHWRGWTEYDMLFGYSRFDPFFAVGAKGWLKDGGVGPSAGVGALYYLTDSCALRADADATLDLDGDVGMVYSLGVGVQLSF